jgi:hypothetical protein
MQGKLVRTIAAIVAGSIISLTTGGVAMATTGDTTSTASTKAGSRSAEATHIKKLRNQLLTAAKKNNVPEVKRVIDQLQAELGKLRNGPTLSPAARDAIAKADERAGELQRTLTDQPGQSAAMQELVYALLNALWLAVDLIFGTGSDEPLALDSDSLAIDASDTADDDTSLHDEDPTLSEIDISDTEDASAEG